MIDRMMNNVNMWVLLVHREIEEYVCIFGRNMGVELWV